MRDPDRLDRYYAELCKLHKQYCPDWRIAQLFVNFCSWCGVDPFYFEEERFMKLVHDYFEDTFK